MWSLKFLGDEGEPRGHQSAGGELTLPVQKIKMSACWVFMILVGCRLSHATLSPNSEWDDRLRNICVPVGDNVTVPCPKFDNGDLSFKLFHNNEMIDNQTCSHGKNEKNCHAGVEQHPKNNPTIFVLTGVNSSSYGIYRCEGTVMYPPPLLTQHERILVLIEGHHCNKVCPHVKQVEQNCGYHWIWILALVSTYSIAVTITAITIWVKLRRTDSQSDYMNTKPKPPRDRKKNRGLQKPIPRHF